jgi:hypothetical protein
MATTVGNISDARFGNLLERAPSLRAVLHTGQAVGTRQSTHGPFRAQTNASILHASAQC